MHKLEWFYIIYCRSLVLAITFFSIYSPIIYDLPTILTLTTCMSSADTILFPSVRAGLFESCLYSLSHFLTSCSPPNPSHLSLRFPHYSFNTTITSRLLCPLSLFQAFGFSVTFSTVGRTLPQHPGPFSINSGRPPLLCELIPFSPAISIQSPSGCCLGPHRARVPSMTPRLPLFSTIIP